MIQEMLEGYASSESSAAPTAIEDDLPSLLPVGTVLRLIVCGFEGRFIFLGSVSLSQYCSPIP